jgi:hypothetical protein
MNGGFVFWLPAFVFHGISVATLGLTVYKYATKPQFVN